MRLYSYLTEQRGDPKAQKQESLHCISFDIAQSKGKVTEADILDGDLFKKSYDNVEISIGYDTLWEFAENNPIWVSSVVTSANAFMNSKWCKKRNYTFYRDHSLVESIYSQYFYFRKKQPSKIKMGPDKWNPADIWASTLSSIPRFDSILDLNKFLSEKLESGDLIGISVKKVGKNAKVELMSSKGEMPEVDYKGIASPTRSGPFVTGINILTGKHRINLRSFRISKAADITGEILGKTARFGKVSALLLKSVIINNRIPQMKKSDINTATDEELKNIVVSLWKDCGYNFGVTEIERSWKNRENKIQDRIGYWQSIIHSLQFGSFLNQNKSIANSIIEEMYINALSLSSLSCDHIKIS